MQKTDERILGTYTKSSSKSRKKKKPDSPARKVSYDVVYPSIDGEWRPTQFIFPFFGEIIRLLYINWKIPQKKSAQHMISNTRLV